MKMIDSIRSRRSIRQYLDKPVGEELVNEILEAGRWAPSGLNNQPWRFLVVRDKKTIQGLAKFTKYSRIIKNAPVVIAVFMDIADSYNRDKDLMAVGACIQNLLLQAHSLDLGTCWLGEILNHRKEVEQFLKAGQDRELLAVITVGFPDEQITQSRRKTLNSLIIKQI